MDALGVAAGRGGDCGCTRWLSVADDEKTAEGDDLATGSLEANCATECVAAEGFCEEAFGAWGDAAVFNTCDTLMT